MSLSITLTPEQEARFQKRAEQLGLNVETYVQRLLDEPLRAEPPSRILQERRPTEAQQRAARLLRSWIAEDATDDPEEIRAAEEDLAAFKRAINENRPTERPIYK